ncbi:hypothetical protein IQ225_19410, partial [Synechocystis salina LEGE 06155]|nr:hypothetical protein [Synechocystis salina LEGE 06155]
TSAIDAVSLADRIDYNGNPNKLAWYLINESQYAPANGIQKAASDYPPVIFTSGAAHYSIRKAAELLGLGSEAVVQVEMDENFRLSIVDLKNKINQAIKDKRAIIAVIGMIGTTEEGSVDPIHEILKLRQIFESKQRQSFWLHVDGAWGGFIRSLFVDARSAGINRLPLSLFSRRMYDLHRLLNIPGPFLNNIDSLESNKKYEYMKNWLAVLWERLLEECTSFDGVPPDGAADAVDVVKEMTNNSTSDHTGGGPQIPAKIDTALVAALDSDDFRNLLAQLLAHSINIKNCPKWIARSREIFSITQLDRVAEVKEFVRDEVVLEIGSVSENFDIQWPNDEVGLAMLATAAANSVTVDPHKMGYTPYPCGAIAFHNDRIRHFVRQEAPYITATKANTKISKPIRYVEVTGGNDLKFRITTAAAAPFTIEG